MGSVDLDGLTNDERWQYHIVNHSAVAAWTFVCWEVIITTADEVQYMWNPPWNWTKLLYFFIRYYTPVSIGIIAFSSACQQLVVFEIISLLALTAAVDIMLMLRVYAIYTRSQKIWRILLAGFIMELIVMGISLVFIVPPVLHSTCTNTEMPIMVLVYGGAAFLFETALLVLTLFKFFSALRESRNRTGLNILRILARDGTWAFAVIFLTMLANVLLFSLAPTTLNSLAFTWLLACLGVVGSRLALNVRAEMKTRSGHVGAGGGIALSDLSSLNFDGVRTEEAPASTLARGTRYSSIGDILNPSRLVPPSSITWTLERSPQISAITVSSRSRTPCIPVERPLSTQQGILKAPRECARISSLHPPWRRAVHIGETTDECF